MKTFALGDVHGGYKALKQVLERSSFNYEEDRLICLGDIADGWPEVPECFDELLKIKNLIYIMGNHDSWLLEFFKFRTAQHIWTSQGGMATLTSYEAIMNMMDFDRMDNHEKLLETAYYKYVDENNNLFVHGGYDWHKDISETSNYELTWNRHMVLTSYDWQRQIDRGVDPANLKIKDFNEVFVGHTSTSRYDKSLEPVHASNVWNIDQGGGYEGKLTIINVDTKEYWQSDFVKELYPEVIGR
jgi:serine/threonine protein phosphatase 1